MTEEEFAKSLFLHDRHHRRVQCTICRSMPLGSRVHSFMGGSDVAVVEWRGINWFGGEEREILFSTKQLIEGGFCACPSHTPCRRRRLIESIVVYLGSSGSILGELHRHFFSSVFPLLSFGSPAAWSVSRLENHFGRKVKCENQPLPSKIVTTIHKNVRQVDTIKVSLPYILCAAQKTIEIKSSPSWNLIWIIRRVNSIFPFWIPFDNLLLLLRTLWLFLVQIANRLVDFKVIAHNYNPNEMCVVRERPINRRDDQ